MWGFIGIYILGLISGVGLMGLMCANSRNDDDFYNGGIV